MLLLMLALQASTPLVTSSSPSTNAEVANAITLPQDTPIELMAPSEVSTADAAPGQMFRLRVNKPVEVGGRVVIPVGTPAFGQVVSSVDAGGLGKSGRMTAKLLSIRLGETEIPLEGEMSAQGTGAGSSTSCPSSTARCSIRCASRWRRARSASRAPMRMSPFRRGCS